MITSKIDNYVVTKVTNKHFSTNAVTIDTDKVKYPRIAKLALWALTRMNAFRPYLEEHTISTFSALEEDISELHNVFWELLDKQDLRDEDYENLVLLVGNVELNEMRVNMTGIHNPLNFRLPVKMNSSKGVIMDGLDVYVVPQMSGYLLVNRAEMMQKADSRNPRQYYTTGVFDHVIDNEVPPLGGRY